MTGPTTPGPDGSVTTLPSRTMLLSSVAERLYWAGRYLERVEGTARLVRTHTELFLDLPRSAGLGWAPLLAVTGSRESFDDDYGEVNEDDVVTFLLADPTHGGSVVSSIGRARENLRITRGLIPRRLWEVVNETDRWVRSSAIAGCDRGRRLMWTEDVIRACHTVAGSATATMSRDQSYAFVSIGRLVERADMTSRVFDVTGLSEVAMGSALGPYRDVTWMMMLRSLGAEQMYRRRMGAMISPPDAVRFLLHDAAFPRSVEYCLIDISRWLLELPHQRKPMAASAAVQRHVDGIDLREVDPIVLHEFVDQLQVRLGALHDEVAETYFLSAELADARP